MAATKALGVEDQGTSIAVDGGTTAVSAVPQRPWIIPLAQMLAVALAVFTIIWNQQQTTESLGNSLRAEISQVETSLRAEIGQVETSLQAEIEDLRLEVSQDGPGKSSTMTVAEAERPNTSGA